MGVSAVALLPILLWLRGCGRGIWKPLCCLSAALALMSVVSMVVFLFDQIFSGGSLILHCVVTTLLIATFVHALTGIGRGFKALPPQKNSLNAE